MRQFPKGILLVLVLVTGTVLGTTGLAGAVSVQEDRTAGQDGRPLSHDGAVSTDNAADGQANQTAGAADSNTDAEPNDNQTTATEISPGENVSGRIDNGDIDVYEVPLSDGERLNVSVLFDHSDADIQLTAGNPAENPVDVSVSSLSRTDNESVSMAALSDEPYYITVRSRTGGSAEYELRTELAGEIRQGNVTGTVTNGSGEPVSGATIRVTDPLGKVAAVASTDSDGEYRLDAPDGEYTVTAVVPWHDPGAQSITVDTGTTTRQDFVLRPGPEANDEYEPNDYGDTPAPITEGSYPRLRLVDGEVDRYAVSLEAGDSITASVDPGQSDGSVSLYLYGPDDDPFGRNMSSYSEDISVSATSVPEGGTYVIWATGSSGDTIPYSLDVAVAPSPGNLTVERDVDSEQLTPGGETTVILDVTGANETVTINETFTRGFASASVRSVTVDGTTVEPAVVSTSSDSVRVVVEEVTSDQTVTVEYAVTASSDAVFGLRPTIAGTVTSNGELPVGTDTINIRPEGSLPTVAAQYDVNGDGEIGAQELGAAGEDFAQGEITAEELGIVGEAFASD